MRVVRIFLFPLVPFYFLVTWLRNKLYDLGMKKSTAYNFPVICVGNLSVGGTGKTPMIEYLVNLLKPDYLVATLSRGYKRKTNGFVLADQNASAATIGDEPFQFYHKFAPDVLVAVDANRTNGIKQLRNLNKKPNVVLLDDAYQHRKVKAGFNILLTTYDNPYFTDCVLPTGNLRESKSGAQRANVIVVTKCPDNLPKTEKQTIIKAIRPKTGQSVFFSRIVYANAVISVNKTILVDNLKSFTLVTGIANANTLVAYLQGKGLVFNHLNYNDHHEFTDTEIDNLSKHECIVTTEKDFMRLKQYATLSEKLYYLPITVKLDRQDDFNTLVRGFVKP
ncbi:MAG: tetraacyldisaccharide 4'-kinase [Flavobacteriaceae bacterium]